MHPVQLPQIVPGVVLVGALAIQKHAVPACSSCQAPSYSNTPEPLSTQKNR